MFSKDDVLLWVAKRAGQSGRNGNTLGTLICADFLCCRNVRVEPAANEINPDPAAVVLRQIDGLVGAQSGRPEIRGGRRVQGA